jgi:hypothetical protein
MNAKHRSTFFERRNSVMMLLPAAAVPKSRFRPPKRGLVTWQENVVRGQKILRATIFFWAKAILGLLFRLGALFARSAGISNSYQRTAPWPKQRQTS